MLGTGAFMTLDNPMWSLVHEMRISLVFPLLTRLAQRHLMRLLLGAAVLFTLLSIGHVTEPVVQLCSGALGRELLHSLINTERYVLFFVLGIVLAFKSAQIGAWLRWQSPVRRLFLWVLAFLLLALPYLAAAVELAYALGATLLLALCMHSSRARRVLTAPALAWLGRISYSLYLVHLVVLLSFVHVLRGQLPLPAILVQVIATSLLVADLTHRLLEMPANHLGKRIAALLRRPAAVAIGAQNAD
jgi:peptidoglycan/LPS O-acetylase OafA/YrhL